MLDAPAAKLRLRRAFRREVARAWRRKRLLFLDLFSGSGRLGKAFRELGFAALSLDLGNGDWQDLTRKEVLRCIEGWLTAYAVFGVWLGPPCTSWSRARRGPKGSATGPLRDPDHPDGLPNLRPEDTAKVLSGNRTRDATARIVECCARLGIPVAVENPVASMLWDTAAFRRLRSLPGFQEVTFDQCGYRADWRKRTKVWGWHCSWLDELATHCRGRGGQCEFTGRPHTVLVGSKLTSASAAYPPKLCEVLAGHYTTAMEEDRHRALQKIVFGLGPS